MQSSIRAIFFDIDGTLISLNTHKIPDTTVRCLNELRRKGIKLFIATGRHKRETTMIDSYFKFDGYVTLNGQYCFNEQDVIYKKCIDKKVIEKVVEHTKNNIYSCFFLDEHEINANRIDDDVVKLCKDVSLNIPNECDSMHVLNKDIYQLLVLLKRGTEKILFKDIDNIEVTRWHDDFVDVMPKGGSKRIGIEKILEHYKISKDEIMAFGDGENDIDMLQYSKIGISMGNASDKVKKHADYVTSHVDDDGIIKALKHYDILS